jgi:hypothetical protein
MSADCPEFETLSRFHDGMIGGMEEGELLAHLSACRACRATLESMEAADALLTAAVAPSGRQARRFRLVPALLPLAAAALFGVTLTYVLTAPSSGASDSPIAVAELTPVSVAPAAEPVANVFLKDRFEAAQLHPVWKGIEGSLETNALVEAEGRRAVQLLAHPAGRKRWGLLSTATAFPVGQGVSFDVDYRIPKAQKGGRMQVLLQTKMPKLGRGVLRWSRTSEEELLEAQVDGRSKPVVLWCSKSEPPDPHWHQLKLTVTGGDVVLHRDGVEVVRKSHGLTFDRVALTLASTVDRRGKEFREPFECQVGRVQVLREETR